MNILLFLLAFPAIVATVLLLIKKDLPRDIVVTVSSFLIVFGSIALLFSYFNKPFYFSTFESQYIDKAMFAIELLLSGYIFYLGVKFKRHWVTILISIQFVAIIAFKVLLENGLIVEHNLFVDKLSILIALIVGVIGGLTCLYSIGYMKDYHSMYGKDVKDHRPLFFSLMFVFLSAMFGVIFSNNLLWLYFFWEITTLCSFFMIGYKRDEESRNNAFKALEINLLGGVAFIMAIAYVAYFYQVIELDRFLMVAKAGSLLPVLLFCFAGLTKSAQLPFSSWLLGAMVAPTPVSALLHSSTMVKAGVYLILRYAVVFYGTLDGYMLALIGGTTFLISSLIAISERDAKKVLAYSTIGSLGLIVMCSGIGTYEAVWAALLLILFHAVAKALLFLSVGVIGHKLHSRDIENMSGLIIRLPRLSIMMQVGMAGMFLAPFGMLISKWAVLKALVDYNPLLAVFVIFGSSATLFFYVKWIGKLLLVIDDNDDQDEDVSVPQWITLFSLSFLTLITCGFFPVISSFLIDPYVREVYNNTVSMGGGNIAIMSMMLAMVMLFPLSFFFYGKNVKVVDPYLGGANFDASTRYRDSLGQSRNMAVKNYYLEDYFGEKVWFKYGMIVCSMLIILMFVVVIK